MTYDDIMSLPHHVSKKHPQMSMHDRAAQFSPFAALTGFDDNIEETNRQVEQFAQFDENYLQELDDKLRYVLEHIGEQPLVEVTYFVPDEIKNGGSYKTICGNVKRIDKDKQTVCFADKQTVDVNSITAINIL